MKSNDLSAACRAPLEDEQIKGKKIYLKQNIKLIKDDEDVYIGVLTLIC